MVNPTKGKAGNKGWVLGEKYVEGQNTLLVHVCGDMC